MPRKIPARKYPRHIAGLENVLIARQLANQVVGTKENYSLGTEAGGHELWPFSTIEWVEAQNRYRARIMVRQQASGDIVAFNSWHPAFADAERVIALVTDSIAGTLPRRVYNIFGEIIETHTSDIGDGKHVLVIEVVALIWSMQQVTAD